MNAEFQQITVVAGIAVHHGKVMVARRKEGTHAGVWEFPGGKVEAGETYQGALKRELKEELGADATIKGPAGVAHMVDGSRWFNVIGYFVEFDEKPTTSSDHDKIEWIGEEDLSQFLMSPADFDLAVQVLSRRQEVTHLGLGSFVRFSVVFYLLFGIFSSMIMLATSQLMPDAEFMPKDFSAAAAFFMPISYCIAGALAAFCGVTLYNFIARFVGGLEVFVTRR